MNAAYIISGEVVDQTTIKLKEPIPMIDGEVTIFIQTMQRTSKKNKPINVDKLIVREVDSFQILERSEIYDRKTLL